MAMIRLISHFYISEMKCVHNKWDSLVHFLIWAVFHETIKINKIGYLDSVYIDLVMGHPAEKASTKYGQSFIPCEFFKLE